MKNLFYEVAVTFMLKNNLMKPICHSCNTRRKLSNVITSKILKFTTQFSYSYVDPSIFNSLPNKLRTLDYNRLKMNLTTWLIQ